MGVNCCGPRQSDGQDRDIDVMLEYTPGIQQRKLRKSKTTEDPTFHDFIIPVKKSKSVHSKKASEGHKGPRNYRLENDDPYRLPSLTSKNLNQLIVKQ